MLGHDHLRLVIVLREDSSKRNSTSQLSRSSNIPYMTTKRCLQELCSWGIVHRCERPRKPLYYELTETGEIIATASRSALRDDGTIE